MMYEITGRPDVAGLEIPEDAWTRPFWEATRARRLMLPCCTDCHDFRWPPGPFCPGCHSRNVTWVDAGEGCIFSFTIVRAKPTLGEERPLILAPALIAFPAAGGIRLLGAVVDAQRDRIAIGASVTPVWVEASNATVPMFTLR
jgi:uncharacterized OB-fold protein